jgi:hypothetical protein
MLLCIIQHLCLCLCFAALGFEPDFLYPLENVTIAQGRDAMFTCVVNNLGGYRVSADLAPARVRALTLLSHSLSHSHSPWLYVDVFLFLCLMCSSVLASQAPAYT